MKASVRRLLFLLAFVLSSLLLLFYFSTRRNVNSLSQNGAPQNQDKTKTRIGVPVRLTIPAINVNAGIEPLGITPQGEMEIPSNTVDVGWFKFGSRPGEKGSAVISGHFNGTNGELGVFAHLDTLKKGDILYIKTDTGTSLTFVVRESRVYDPGYADDVFSKNDNVHLNLVTCDGAWDTNKKSYSKRLVVFADMIQ
ncbi:class F sortase [Patescibacteria group bacterium]|nr:class F sortase [Patescibacteria group bacterium]